MIDFSWFLPEVGHEVVPKPVAVSAETDIDALWIRPVEQSTSSANAWRRYTLIQSEGGLFRRFAAIEFKPQSIVEFADQYGLLTDSRRGEPLSVWKAAIEEMEYVVAYWERARQLGITLYPCDDKVTFFTKEAIEDATSFADSSDDSIAPVIPLSTRSTDHGDDCTTYSHRAINFVPDRMNRHDALGMIASRIRKNLSSTRIGFRTFESETKLHGLTLRLFPATLLEAMWLQLAIAIWTNKSFLCCPNCRTWFDVSPKSHRTSKIFCSEACKARAYRYRLAMRANNQRQDEELRRAQLDSSV